MICAGMQRAFPVCRTISIIFKSATRGVSSEVRELGYLFSQCEGKKASDDLERRLTI
jgi:hypothetical protein